MRIDRIYCLNEVAKSTFDWKIRQTSVPMDHWMVAVKYAPKEALYRKGVTKQRFVAGLSLSCPGVEFLA